MDNSLTMRDRFLAILHGAPVDKMPFTIYDSLGPTSDSLMQKLGPEQIMPMRWMACHTIHTPNCQITTEPCMREARAATSSTLHTPAGTLTQIRLDEPDFSPSAVFEHYIKQTVDFEVLLSYLKDTRVEANDEPVRAANFEMAEYGLVHCVVPRTPYQQLLVEWVDSEELSWHLLEDAALVHACMEEMMRILREVFAIIADTPLPYVVFPDNLHAPIIGRSYFNRYCVPFYNELADILYDDGVPVLVRGDGDLKPLWYDIEDSYLTGVEALRPSPEHDTSVADALRVWPNQVIGVQVPPGVHLKPASVVYDKSLELIRESQDSQRMFLQIADLLPHGRWRVSLPAIARAIEDHAASFTT